ncbi:hypothetical protein [Corynebacterium singulare]|uniref:hypothetical protein n=1 Tax=Corynebacterium singulare TaxID=161899 RepID=UPI0028CB1579|nr:hypothetical protein [Corynebacterium singulare]
MLPNERLDAGSGGLPPYHFAPDGLVQLLTLCSCVVAVGVVLPPLSVLLTAPAAHGGQGLALPAGHSAGGCRATSHSVGALPGGDVATDATSHGLPITHRGMSSVRPSAPTAWATT